MSSTGPSICPNVAERCPVTRSLYDAVIWPNRVWSGSKLQWLLKLCGCPGKIVDIVPVTIPCPSKIDISGGFVRYGSVKCGPLAQLD